MGTYPNFPSLFIVFLVISPATFHKTAAIRICHVSFPQCRLQNIVDSINGYSACTPRTSPAEHISTRYQGFAVQRSRDSANALLSHSINILLEWKRLSGEPSEFCRRGIRSHAGGNEQSGGLRSYPRKVELEFRRHHSRTAISSKARPFCSSSSIFFLVLTPPGAEKPPRPPSVRSTRWHGMIRGRGFLASALPAARLADAARVSRIAGFPNDAGLLVLRSSCRPRQKSGSPRCQEKIG